MLRKPIVIERNQPNKRQSDSSDLLDRDSTLALSLVCLTICPNITIWKQGPRLFLLVLTTSRRLNSGYPSGMAQRGSTIGTVTWWECTAVFVANIMVPQYTDLH